MWIECGGSRLRPLPRPSQNSLRARSGRRSGRCGEIDASKCRSKCLGRNAWQKCLAEIIEGRNGRGRHEAERLPRPDCGPSRADRLVYLRAAQAYMLISMPTGTSTIFGVFQVIRVSQLARRDDRAVDKGRTAANFAQVLATLVSFVATGSATHVLAMRGKIIERCAAAVVISATVTAPAPRASSTPWRPACRHCPCWPR
jgi:hypothetical protein